MNSPTQWSGRCGWCVAVSNAFVDGAHGVLKCFFKKKTHNCATARQVVDRGLSVEEALAATSQPCSNKTLYRRVAAKRKAIKSVAADGTRAFLQSNGAGVVVVQGSDCDISALTESPMKRRKLPEQVSEVSSNG